MTVLTYDVFSVNSQKMIISQHFVQILICLKDLNSYLSENIMAEVFKCLAIFVHDENMIRKRFEKLKLSK